MAKKVKISAVKRSNQKRNKLTKQGKLKQRRHKPAKKPAQKPPQPRPEEKEEESDDAEDLMNMVEEDDLNFLKNAISNKSYSLLKQIRFSETDDTEKKRRGKKKGQEKQPLEEIYEDNASKIAEEEKGKKVRMLLPIKKQNGILEKRMIEEEEQEGNENENDEEATEPTDATENGTDEMEIETDLCDKLPHSDSKPISTIELLACREEVLQSKRLKIGLLASGLLEDPELKSANFRSLLDLMDEANPEVYITVRKLATVSLLEVYKDILPSYHIHETKQEGVKLKKQTLQLQRYEAVLLSTYKQYLQRLEKLCNVLRRKKGDTRRIVDAEIPLGELAVKCMCELLVTHPYFNFSTNIATFLVPLLDNKRPTVREKVAACISQTFKEDKRGEISLTIVRKLNQYVKLKAHSVHSEVLSVLLSLRIKEVNLDQEKEEETKQKKLMSHKQRLLALSKRERKKNKQLEEVEKELLETKAEENKQTKQKLLTEITSIVFTIYFRILKEAPNSKLLSVCLEGLAKFAHCINLDFYQDLVAAINRLMEQGNLGLREQLHCIQCVFTILSGHGMALNIDPYKFYVHLYKNLLNVHYGRTNGESEIVIKTLVQVLIQRRKRITQSRLIAFVKRIATLALQTQHNAVLGLLCIVKQIMQLGKTADVLLDTDFSTGDGFYQPELEEPEYCNAHCTALWELAALQRHYHNPVKKMAKNIAYGVPTTGEGSLQPEISKFSPEEIYTEFDPTGVVFKPAVPVPKKSTPVAKKATTVHHFQNDEFANYMSNVNNNELFADGYVDFYSALKSS